jgi:Domain of unknown function (DUF4157)
VKSRQTVRAASSPSAETASSPGVPPIVHEVLKAPGQSLDDSTRGFMEARFAHDFSQVRVHTDSRAAESTQAVNAQAYTVGPNVVFGAGQFAPHTTSGRHLLAHELTHVVQQSQFSARQPLGLGPANDAYEQVAEHTADSVMNHQLSPGPVVSDGAPNMAIQRVVFGKDGELSPARKATVQKAANIAERLVMGGGGIYTFRKKWEAFWAGPGAKITPKPTLESYQQALKGRVVHDMDTSTQKDIVDFLKDEKAMPLERQTAAVTKVGSTDTFMRGFAIDQGVDSVVSLLLHESLHGAGLPMGPMEVYEPLFHQFESDVGFPLMMGGGDIVKIDQKRKGDTDVDVTITYNLHKIDEAGIPAKIMIQIVWAESGEVVFDEQPDGSRKPAQAIIPSKTGQGTWVWHARYQGGGTHAVRLRDMTSESLIASRDFEPNPRCTLGVSTMHCEGE